MLEVEPTGNSPDAAYQWGNSLLHNKFVKWPI